MKRTWKDLFQPHFTHGGVDNITRGLNGVVFDDFEDYANSTAVQAVWTEANGAGNPTLVTGTNAVHGQKSMQTVVSGSDGEISRTINQNEFGGPFPKQIRYINFRATVDSGTDQITVRLSDASDANLYREWTVSANVSTSKLQDYTIDLNPNNDESYAGPSAEGSTAWDPDLIDTFEFRGLADGSTFKFDDIVFYYEYSVSEAIGIGTQAATSAGVDGSVHSKLRNISDELLELTGTTSQYNKYGPTTVFLNNAYTWGLELKGTAGQGIPTTGEITPGTYIIDRVRDGTSVEIVASAAATEAAGFISAAYTPLEDNWVPGDQLIVTFTAGAIEDEVGAASALTGNATSGTTPLAVADSSVFTVGQRVRVYDDLATEYNTVATIDTPTQISVSVNLGANYTTANNAAVILVAQTLLQNARFSTNISFDEDMYREVERWALADYDDFDLADADGNNDRWNVEYIANSDGTAAGAEGGSADINTTTSGKARVEVDPDGTPVRAAYALSRNDSFKSRWYSTSVDMDATLVSGEVTSSYAGLRISSGSADDAANYVLIARETNSGLNRITANAEFGGAAETPVTFTTTDTAMAFKIERYDGTWNLFYSLTQYPNWQWVKLTQFEDASDDMGPTTTVYLYAESAPADAEITQADFDNWKYYINSGALDQILGSSLTIMGTGVFTTSSTTVPADTSRAENNDYWDGVLLVPTTGSAAYQPRAIVNFANAGGVFTMDVDHPFTTAPAVGDEYVLLAAQADLIPTTDSTTDTTSAHVVGAKADTADYTYNATTSSLQRLVKGLLGSRVIGEGTFTTSSATVPADTSHSAKANEWYKGQILIPLTGDVAFQPRLIVDFATTTGIFTMDADHPFTAATGTVAYIIIANEADLVADADAVTNTTAAHVTGNKTDAIPAMNAAPANSSVVAQLKAILERVGATPADPDDSLLTSIGQRDATATSDDLSDVTTTDVEAKLRRLLLRFSSDAFTSTVQGVARTDVENMIQGLANYMSAAGAAWSSVVDPGGATRTDLETTLEDFAAMLAGAAGITTFPAAAIAANGVSLAEVLRHASESIGEDSANNTFASTLVVANEDGSVLERLEDVKLTVDTFSELGVLADFDNFDVADADANTERWNVGYNSGSEGGAANISTSSAGKLYTIVDPDATPTAASYGVNLAQPIVSKYFTTIVDVDAVFGTPSVSWATVGVRISPTTYDSNNVVYLQRQNSSGGVGDRIAAGAFFGSGNQGEVYFTTADAALAFKIERWDNVWRLYYSLAQSPDYVWVLLTQYEDASENMVSEQTVYLDSYSPGSADAETAQGDFDNFKLYIGGRGVSQEIAGDYDSSAVAANEDGSVIERLEQIQEATNVGTGTSMGANKSIADALGTNGITLVDDAASVVGILGVDDADNAFASTNVVANRDGSILERLEALITPLTTEATGPFSYLDAGAEQDVYEDAATTTRRKVWIEISNQNMTQTGTFRLYRKVDGVTYDQFSSDPVLVAAGEDRAFSYEFVTNQHFKVTYEEDADEGAARDIDYNVIVQAME